MISSGRYAYHMQDIAEIERKPKPLSPVDEFNLARMKREVEEYEAGHSIQRESSTSMGQAHFIIDDLVAWNTSYPGHKIMSEKHGAGPFRVTATIHVPREEVGDVAHAQWLKVLDESTQEPIRGEDGSIQRFSGMWFTKTP